MGRICQKEYTHNNILRSKEYILKVIMLCALYILILAKNLIELMTFMMLSQDTKHGPGKLMYSLTFFYSNTLNVELLF